MIARSTFTPSMSEDCIRKSIHNISQAMWGNKDYTLISELNSSSSKACKDKCISDLNCAAWWYDEIQGKCYGSNTLPPSLLKEEMKGASSGVIACEPYVDYLRLFVIILAMIIAIVVVYFLLNKCVDKTCS